MQNNTWLRTAFTVILFCVTVYLRGQVFIEQTPTPKSADPVINMYGSGNLIVSIPYEKVKGSAFWKDDYELANLYGANARSKWFCRSRLNLVSGEVYFLDKNNQELVANDPINLIIFYKGGDTTVTDAVFVNVTIYPDLIQTKELTSGYLQVLNTGKYQLLKYYKRTVASADSLFGTVKRYYFVTQNRYFISGNQKIEPIKRLTKENVLPDIPASTSCSDWIAQNKIDFRKEEDVVKFLNYYNSKNQ